MVLIFSNNLKMYIFFNTIIYFLAMIEVAIIDYTIIVADDLCFLIPPVSVVDTN